MKKRSLVAAVAMLLVSALVLTSATFAWFAKGEEATVGAVSAHCSNSDGALLVSASSTTGFKTALTYADFGLEGGKDASNNDLYNELIPIDMRFNPAHTSVSQIGCNYDGVTFEPTTAASGAWMEYTFYLKNVGATADVDLAPVFDAGTGSAPYVFGAVKCNGLTQSTKWYIFGDSDYYQFAGDSWASVTEETDAANGIVDSNDTGANVALGSTPTKIEPDDISGENYPFVFTAAKDQVYTINVLIWAEGQEQTCIGVAENTGANFAFTPEIQ